MASKTLRLPQGNEWKKLPRTKAQAIDKGLNRFIGEDGQLREIRKFGSSRYPQGTVERWSSRKQNRGSSTGGSRQINEQLATPPWANKTKFGQAMAEANSMGLDGDHIREIARTAEGVKWLESTGRGTAEQMFTNYEKAGLPLGNQAGNVQPLDPVLNRQVKNADMNLLDRGIQRAGQEADKVFSKLRGTRGSIGFSGTNFRSVTPGTAGLIEFVPMIDEITGGHLEKTLNQGIESLKGTVRFAATSVRDAYANTKPLGYDLNLQ